MVAWRLVVLEEEGWTLVCMDGLAKQVHGLWQAGYGAWFGEGDVRNKHQRSPRQFWLAAACCGMLRHAAACFKLLVKGTSCDPSVV